MRLKAIVTGTAAAVLAFLGIGGALGRGKRRAM
jgi:hypothetical protein